MAKKVKKVIKIMRGFPTIMPAFRASDGSEWVMVKYPTKRKRK